MMHVKCRHKFCQVYDIVCFWADETIYLVTTLNILVGV